MTNNQSPTAPVPASQSTPRTLAERLALALERSGRKQVDLVRACGISHPSVSAWFSGRTKSISGPNALAAAVCLGVNPDWLSRGVGPMEPEPPELKQFGDLVAIEPLILDPASQQAIAAEVALSKRFFQNAGVAPENCRTLTAVGDAMAPLISDGDRVLLDTSESAKEIATSKVYAVRLANEGVVRLMRLLKRIDGSMKIWGDNKDVSEGEIISPNEASKLNILGRVIARVGTATL